MLLSLGTYHFVCVCVCVGGGGGEGEVNFEGGNRKKADLINYEFVQGGNTFFENPNL